MKKAGTNVVGVGSMKNDARYVGNMVCGCAVYETKKDGTAEFGPKAGCRKKCEHEDEEVCVTC